ncbi:MAG TPA: O-antigen ligase family protein [Gaiellaceae bacterium]|nr:O-antigen ligase family protein [Gaiellaceae bacterium]
MTARPHDRRLPSPGAIVLALAVPLLFLHTHFLPGATVRGAHANLADLAAVAVAIAGLWTGFAEGFGPLRAGRWVWAATAALFVLIAVSIAYADATDSAYLLGKHSVTALKLLEYALMAPAVVLIVRRRRDLELLFASVTVWAVAALGYGLLQFFGAIDDFSVGHKRAGGREPSFLGPHDFAALSSMALALALAAVALGPVSRRERRWVIAAGAVGATGLVLSGAIAGVLGLGLAALAAGLVALRRSRLSLGRVAGLAGIVAAVLLGTLVMRSSDVSQFLKFLGIRPGASQASLGGSSYSQRTVLAYFGVQIFAHHPVFGVGWQESAYEDAYRPYLAAARRRFPDVAPLAFPSPQHRWGVQNLYLQAAADMGVIGLAALLALLGSGLVAGLGWALRAPPSGAALALVPVLWLLMAIGIWNGLGLVAGIPLSAMTWLSLGLVAVRLD